MPRARELTYRRLMEQASDGIHTYDFEGNFIDVNPGLCRMLGYTRAELLRLKVTDLVPPEDLDSTPIRFDELRAGGNVVSERRLLRKDGTLLPVEISGARLQEGLLQAIVRDISARKRAEDELRRSEEWLRAILHASRDGIIVEKDERIVYANDAYARLLGYDCRDELVGSHVSAVVSPHDVGRLVEFGKRRVCGEAIPSLYEFEGKRKDGTPIDLEASVSTQTVGGETYITTAIRDIADRKRSAEALLRARDELEERVGRRTAELARANEVLQTEIAERRRTEEARQELLRRLDAAQEEERRRISLELHDQVGQHLTAIMHGLQSLKLSPRCEPTAVANKLRIFLADDHALIREGVKFLVNAQPNMEVVGEADGGTAAWLKIKETRPDVVVMDVSVPETNGAQKIERLKRDCPGVKVLALTGNENRGYLHQLLDAGASGYLLKRAAADDLIRAIRVVAAGGVYLDPTLAGKVVSGYGHRQSAGDETHGGLSNRETEVLRRIALGYGNKEIAAQLSLSVRTVETYKIRLMEKLELGSRADIVRYAIHQGWLQEA